MINSPRLFATCMSALFFLIASRSLSAIGPLVTGKQHAIAFTENKGQISDQFYQPRPDVLFSGSAGNMVYHLKNNGVSYQIVTADAPVATAANANRDKDDLARKTVIYRLDLNWLNTRNDFRIQRSDPLPGYTNYYVETCPQGALNVKTYSNITYKNIYDKIDLKYYGTGGSLEYDYIVHPGADYRQIAMQVAGASKIAIGDDGSLRITTPCGEIRQEAPVAMQNHKKLKSKWMLKENILSFDVTGYDASLPFVIDPLVRLWGTFYGGAGDDVAKSCATDGSGNVFLTGATWSNTLIATSGSHQFTYGGGTFADVFLVKFDPSGNRLWATYYGAMGSDGANGCATDANGNIYVAGTTSSSNTPVISTPGSHKANYLGGGNDICEAMLIKFNGSGVRLWATYYGGDASDYGLSCTVDNQGDLYMCGSTSSTVGISTPGSFQSLPGSGLYGTEAFLVKFSSTGTRLWATYFGDTGNDAANSCAVDNAGSVYLCGSTSSTVNIATPGSHQPVFLFGGAEAFLAKFNSSGARQWCTYYGTNAEATCCTANRTGDVFITGSTATPSSSTSINTSIASPGAHQPYFAGYRDAFVARFSANGVRQWGTYYGAGGNDGAVGCTADIGGNVYISGFTVGNSTNAEIVTPNGYQTVYGGGSVDGFFAKFNSFGVRQWGSFYGGNSNMGSYWDQMTACTIDTVGNLYIAGYSDSQSGIASPGSFQPAFAGGYMDPFLVKFNECISPLPVNSTSALNAVACAGNSATLAVTSQGALSWFASETSTAVVGTGSLFISPVLAPGVYNFYAEATNSCTANRNRTPVTFTVRPLPTFTFAGTSTSCFGAPVVKSVTTSASTYTWSNGISNSPITTTLAGSAGFTVNGTDAYGCTNSAITSVTIYPLPVLITSPSTIICVGESVLLTVNGARTYMWSDGTTGSSVTVSPVLSKPYSVTGTDLKGCSVTAQINVNTIICTSMRESTREDKSVKIYPNPTNGLFTIETKENTSVRVVNILGELILVQDLQAGTNELSLTTVCKGIYFVEVTLKGSIAVLRLIKE